MHEASPGWHPDPTGRFQFRWFNGERWTADVSTNGQRFVDPAPLDGGSPPRRGLAIAGFVVACSSAMVAWLPVVFVVGGVGAIVAFVLSIVAWRRSRHTGGHGRNYARGGAAVALLAMGLTVPGYVMTKAVVDDLVAATDLGNYDIVIDRCDSTGGLTVVDGYIRNLDDRAHTYVVVISFVVAQREVANRSVQTATLDPGGRADFHVTEFIDDGPVECTADTVSGRITPW